MSKAVVGVFDTYGEAAEVVRDLEIAGIVGEQVELISGADEEAPFGGGSQASSGVSERLPALKPAHQDAGKKEVHDYYVEDPEFYAGKSRKGRAVVVVRPVGDKVADTAADVLRRHGARSLTGDSGPEIRSEDGRPETIAQRNVGDPAQEIGANRATTGGDQRDLEGRGKQMQKSKSD